MDDIEQKATRVRQLTEGSFGKVLGREGDVMTVEVPSDLSVTMPWGQIEGGVVACVTGQRTGMAERRVASMNGATVTCKGDMITQAFYTLAIDLAPKMQEPSQPTPASIMRQTTTR